MSLKDLIKENHNFIIVHDLEKNPVELFEGIEGDCLDGMNIGDLIFNKRQDFVLSDLLKVRGTSLYEINFLPFERDVVIELEEENTSFSTEEPI